MNTKRLNNSISCSFFSNAPCMGGMASLPSLACRALAIASRPDVIFTSYGDMLRVPGSESDLFHAKSRGADVRIVYSPLDAVKIAGANPTRQVVFFAVGFETTAPANAMALQMPERVRQVITLGSPLTGHPKGTNAWRVFELVSGFRHDDERLMELVNGEPSVPTTSIMSKTDGVVNWRMSLAEESPIAENIEVSATHMGMGANPAVLWIIADRLPVRFQLQLHKVLWGDTPGR